MVQKDVKVMMQRIEVEVGDNEKTWTMQRSKRRGYSHGRRRSTLSLRGRRRMLRRDRRGSVLAQMTFSEGKNDFLRIQSK